MPEASHTTNNFNLLRLAFALMVVAYHITLVIPSFWWTIREPMAELAEIGVQGFFVLSGYLVYASYERSDSLALYAEKRFRRLYPAYAVVILVCAIAALAISAQARADLAGVGRYVGWNLVFANFMAPRLPGIFVENGGTEINGALWTLKIEVMFYIALPLLAWLLRVSGRLKWVVFFLIYAAAEVWRFYFASIEQHELARQLPGQMSFFVTGMALHRLQIDGSRFHAVAGVGILLLAASLVWPLAEPARAAGLGVLAIWAATAWPKLPDAARFGDLSYGVYIVHFPIIQTVAVLGIFAIDRWLGIGVAATTSILAAFLLWHLVEKPALRADSAYRWSNA